ncbi:MAG: hypothetical protein U0K36_08815 [Bacteroidales bacterium]|nr:hypothetical protein [Bacteroidales bacterium]
MLKKTITYIDYNGKERTETHYFDLNEVEATEMELSVEGGMSKKLEAIAKSEDKAAMFKFFKELIAKSYGVKSEDGRRFIKSEQITEEFAQSRAYVKLIMELAQDGDKLAAFFNGVIPKVDAPAAN